jgi:long-chain acyl-CoA synthetase
LEVNADRVGSKVALKSDAGSITFSGLSARSDLFAGALMNIGLKKFDRVLLLLSNIPEFAISFYGALKAGCTLVTVNHLVRQDELKRVLEETTPKAAVVMTTLAAPERAVLEASRVKAVAVGEPPEKSFIGFTEFTARASASFGVSAESKDPAVIQYTGSTTGAPKPVVMSHGNLFANAIQNATWFSWDEKAVVMGVLPLCHTWGCSCCMNSPIYTGATTILIDRFDPEDTLKKIESERATVLYGSATMFSMLLAHPSLSKYDISSLKWAKAGAMPVPIELKRRWDGETGVEMTLGYGLTEASPETHDSPPGKTREGSIGIPITDTDARIVDVDSGAEVDTGRPGELLISGPQVSDFGYLGDDEETKKTFKEGWLCTGDIAVMDGDGYFRLIDRKRDIIKYKGYTIYPVELENVLYEHPGVKECAVVGIKHPEYGEVPKAFIVCRDEASVASEAVISFTQQRLTPYKKIREVEFVKELPKTHVGKVLRRRLRGET